MSFMETLRAARARAAQRSVDPLRAKVEAAVRGKGAISTAALLDMLDLPKTTGSARRIAKTMRELGFIPLKSRRLMPGGFRDTVARGWARPVRQSSNAVPSPSSVPTNQEVKMEVDKTVEYQARALVDRLFDEQSGRPGELCRCPIIDCGYVRGVDRVGKLKEKAVRAVIARECFTRNGPPDAPPLPLNYGDREELKHGGLDHMVALYARSLALQDYDWRKHPSFYEYACGVMASQETPIFITEDEELRKRFPPRPLPGLGSGLIWEPEPQLRAA
jgi:hypothetical protein